MPTLTIGGTPLYYEDKGKGAPVVLLHAFPVNSEMWEAQIEALSVRHRVIAPDFRGFGQSAACGPFTMESLADDVQTLLMKLSTGPVILGGLSMGGYVALAFAEKYQALLRGLMLIDTKAEADDAKAKEGRGKMIELARSQGGAAVGEAMQSKLLSADALANKPLLVKKLRGLTDGTAAQTIEFALGAMRDRPDRSEVLKSLAVPVLIVVGDGDVVTPPTGAEAMRKLALKAELVVIQGSGHLTAMEQPEQLNSAMERFVSRVLKE
jgi:3-oxoadipate enol-lactonase